MRHWEQECDETMPARASMPYSTGRHRSTADPILAASESRSVLEPPPAAVSGVERPPQSSLKRAFQSLLATQRNRVQGLEATRTACPPSLRIDAADAAVAPRGGRTAVWFGCSDAHGRFGAFDGGWVGSP
jgi:hypothetical protein